MVQRERFGQQQKDRDSGDTESQQLDEGFCLALEYGLPPTTGWAVGIDRLWCENGWTTKLRIHYKLTD